MPKETSLDRAFFFDAVTDAAYVFACLSNRSASFWVRAEAAKRLVTILFLPGFAIIRTLLLLSPLATIYLANPLRQAAINYRERRVAWRRVFGVDSRLDQLTDSPDSPISHSGTPPSNCEGSIRIALVEPFR